MTLALDAGRAALLLVDVQERLSAAMPADGMATLTRNTGILLQLARRLSLPIVVSEQYPRGLGRTISALEEALSAMDRETVSRFEKVEFSACASPAFESIEQKVGRDQSIVAGMEAHVCVYQTVRHLRDRGADVHVVRDAVLSRTADNLSVGLALMERTGAVVTSTETVLFDLLARAGTDDFKALSPLIR